MADRPNPAKRIAQAATGVVNLVVVGTAAVGAAALHSWAILALGGAAYGALVAWDLVGGRKGAAPGAAEPPQAMRLKDPSDYKDPSTQAAVRAIVAARLEIDKVLTNTPADVQGHLALALLSVDELEERAAKLAQRGEDLASYLRTTDPRVVQQDVHVLSQRVAATTDPEARAQYESAHQARREHLQTLHDLVAARERIHASMLSIAATLEGLPAKIVRMRALDARAMDKLTGDVKDELDRMNGEIRTFEETLKSLGEVGSA
jgi:hypothetical protein